MAIICYLKLARSALHDLWVELLISQRDPHIECHKSRKALLAHFKWYRVTCACGRLAFNLHFLIASSASHLWWSIVSSAIQLDDLIQTYHAFWSGGKKGEATIAVAASSRHGSSSRWKLSFTGEGLSLNLKRNMPEQPFAFCHQGTGCCCPFS